MPTIPANDASKSGEAQSRDQAIDLVTLIHPRELDKSELRSLVAESLGACDPKQLASLDQPLESLAKTHPGDLSVAIVVALRALASDDSQRIAPALERLNELVKKSTLEPLPAGTRPNARQRTDAARQLPLWFVARACERQSSAAVRELSNQLAAQALEAARRQSDPRWTAGDAPRARPARPRPS